MKSNMINKRIISRLKKVNDPELGISIYDLGLIYKITEKAGNVLITMTLTSPSCPLYPMIKNDIIQNIKKIKSVKTVKIKLVFEPAWNVDNMTPLGKAMLGLS